MDTVIVWFKTIVALLPFPYLLMLTAVILFGAALFLPVSFQQSIGIYDLTHAYRALEWFVFSGCSVFLFLRLTQVGASSVREDRRIKTRLCNLSEAEQLTLTRLTDGKLNSVIAWPHEAGVATLHAEKIIESRPSALMNDQMVYILPPKVRSIYAKISKL